MNSDISREDIEALFGGAPKKDEGNTPLTAEEIDTLGEVGNICMGTAATTLGEIVGRRVRITTPRVRVINLKELSDQYQTPFVVVEVRYTEGLEGNNVLILKEEDVLLITDLMVGGAGIALEGKLTDMHLSAISETMNQMMGASATSMSDMLGRSVQISPPKSTLELIGDEKMRELFADSGDIIQVSFSLEIEGLANSEIMQLMPIWFGRELVNALLNRHIPRERPGMPAQPEVSEEELPQAGTNAEAMPMWDLPASAPQPEPAQYAPPAPAPYTPPASAPAPSASFAAPQPASPSVSYDPFSPPAQPAPSVSYEPFAPSAQPAPSAMPARPAAVAASAQARPAVVDARPVRYMSFDEEADAAETGGDGINLIIDVPLQVTIELGKCRKTVKEVLDFKSGTILVLEKLAGEPVEIVVNEKLIARGEVIQIDDNYGVRITEILNKSKPA